MKLKLSLAFYFFCLAFPANAQLLNPINEIQNSHIEANVPPEVAFGPILKRDLTKFFEPDFENAKLAVSYQLLRQVPTQSGVSYPKYYAWVVVKSENGELLQEGAVRLAAIEKVRFEVTEFVSAKEIQISPEKLDFVFPKLLVQNIKGLAGSN